MRSVVGAGLEWLGRLWRRDTPADEAWEPGVRPVVEAVGAVETMACDAVAHRPMEPVGARHADRAAGSGGAVRNAFGRPIATIEASGAAGAVATATGLALTGRRATAWLRGRELAETLPALRAAAERLAPLVVHVVDDQEGAHAGHDGYHAVADAGWFQVLAHSGQHAVDLTLLARWLAERALVPGLVAEDGLGVDAVRVPDPEAVRGFLGWPEEALASPTEAQRLVFGPERRRVVGWFDPDHPMAIGGARDPAEAAAAAVGRDRFYARHLPGLAAEGMAALSRITGRPLHFVDTWGLERCDRVLVAQGSLVEAARAVAEHLRQTSRLRVGVVGVTWLRPFPAEALAAALDGHRAVAVVERTTVAGLPPLYREIRAALGEGSERWIRATTADAPTPEALIDLCEALSRPDCPAAVRLDRHTPGRVGPRRQALDLAVDHAYPDESVRPSGATWPVHPGAMAVVGLDTDLAPDEPGALADALAADVGPVVRGALAQPLPGVRLLRLTADTLHAPDPGPGAPVRLLVALSDPRRLGAWPARVAPGGALLLVGASDPPPPLPGAWIHRIREGGLTVHVAAREGWIDQVAHWDEQAPDPVPDGAIVALGSPSAVPAIVQRIDTERRAPDSLPRFWGEQLAPRLLEGPEAPDPVAAAGVVPALATALVPAPAGPLPVLDADRCTGCGVCWAACPDSAIGVSVLSPEALLTAASRHAGTQGGEADALRRAHKHLAARVAGQVREEQGAIPADTWRDAFAWLLDRLKVDDPDRPGWGAAFEATLERVARLDPVLTEPFFTTRERASRGTGDLLAWAVDPRACQGCGLCVAECPEDALSVAAVPDVAPAVARRAAWEALPDTPGEVVARAWDDLDTSALAAATLSRHCAEAQVGGGVTEPASGERLASRAVAALAEYHGQRRQAAWLRRLREQRQALEEWIREALVASVATADDHVLADALAGPGGTLDLADLATRLAERGATARVDRPRLQRATHLAERLGDLAGRLAEGTDGLGRARFGVVAAPGAAVDALLRFPGHPFFAPLVVDGSPQTLDLARGVAEGLVAAHLEAVRSLRAAALLVDAPRDLDERLAQAEGLQWHDLHPEERLACPPLVLLADDTILPEGLGFLGRLSEGALPVKLVLLDGLSLDRAAEPALVALAHRDLFAMAGSVGYPDALARDLLAALEFPGPALIHLHAPSPARHGFAPEATLATARAAVAARAHVLLRYDPRAEGTFGTRLDLSANPDPEAAAEPEALRAWAASQARFTGRADDPALQAWVSRRLATWRTLREIAGDAGPFIGRIRDAARAEVQAAREAELAALRAEHARALDALRAEHDREAVRRLTDQLMVLAGHPSDAGRPS